MLPEGDKAGRRRRYLRDGQGRRSGDRLQGKLREFKAQQYLRGLFQDNGGPLFKGNTLLGIAWKKSGMCEQFGPYTSVPYHRCCSCFG